MGNTTTTSFSQNKKELLKLLLEERQQQSCLPTLNAREWSGPRPLSFAQQRLWFLDQWQPGNVNYSIPVLIRLSGELDVGALEQSFAEILRRHETLRASLSWKRGIRNRSLRTRCRSPCSPLTSAVWDSSKRRRRRSDSRSRNFRRPSTSLKGHCSALPSIASPLLSTALRSRSTTL